VPSPPRWLSRTPGSGRLTAWYRSDVIRRQACAQSNRYETTIKQLSGAAGARRRALSTDLRSAVESYLMHESARTVAQALTLLLPSLLVFPTVFVALIATWTSSPLASAAVAVLVFVLLGLIMRLAQRFLRPAGLERPQPLTGGVAIAVGGAAALAHALVPVRSSIVAGGLIALVTFGVASVPVVVATIHLDRADRRWRRAHLRELGLCIFVEASHFGRAHAGGWGTASVITPLTARLDLLADEIERQLPKRMGTQAEATRIAGVVRGQKALLHDSEDRLAFDRYAARSVMSLHRDEWSSLVNDWA
jgi:hypothetical protein